jgi:hypothetical protein
MEAQFIDQFKTLWDEVEIMVDFETKRLIEKHDPNIVKKLNGYYLYEVLRGLWFSEILLNKYGTWYDTLTDMDKPCAEEVKKFLWENNTLLDDNDEDKLVRNVLSGGLAGSSILAAFAKRPKLALLMLGAAAITFFFNGNEKKITAEARSLVAKRLAEIENGVVEILTRIR